MCEEAHMLLGCYFDHINRQLSMLKQAPGLRLAGLARFVYIMFVCVTLHVSVLCACVPTCPLSAADGGM